MRAMTAMLLLGLSGAALAQPARTAATPTLAQSLVMRTLAADAGLTALTLHVDEPGGRNVVAGSNVAPLGKLADADDEAVRRSDAPIAGLNPAGTRYGVAIKLHASSGAVIGTVNFGFAPAPDDDRARLVARSEALLARLESQIPDAAALFAPE